MSAFTDYAQLRTQFAQLKRQARETCDAVRELLTSMPFPEKLRQATAADVVVGAVFFYHDGDDGKFFQIVEEVHYPNDPWKAYTADDGCRYGLDGAFVEAQP